MDCAVALQNITQPNFQERVLFFLTQVTTNEVHTKSHVIKIRNEQSWDSHY